MGKKRISPTDITNESKRTRIEDTINTADLPEILLKTFKETQSFKLRKKILVQAINANNLELFTQLLNSYKTIAKSLHIFLFLVGSPTDYSAIATAVSAQKWDFLEVLTTCILEVGTQHKGSRLDLTKSTVESYFLYVAIHECVSLEAIQGLQTHFNITQISNIKFNGHSYNCLEHILSWADYDGIMRNTLGLAYFKFLWEQLTPQQKEGELDYFIKNPKAILFFISQGIVFPESSAYGKRLAFLLLGRKNNEFHCLLKKIIAEDPKSYPKRCNPFKFINFLDLLPAQLLIIINNYSPLLTKTYFEHSSIRFGLYEHHVGSVLKIIQMFNTKPNMDTAVKIKYAQLVIKIAPPRDLAQKLIPLLNSTEILMIFDSLLNDSQLEKRDLETVVKETIVLRPSIQKEFWDYMKKLFFTDQKNSTDHFLILKWFNLGDITLKEKQFMKQLVEENKKTLDGNGQGHYTKVIDYFREDIRYSNLLNSLLTQVSKPAGSTEEVEDIPAPPPISAEEQQLLVWKEKLEKRYGQTLLDVNGWAPIFSFRLFNNLYTLAQKECSNFEIPITNSTFMKLYWNEFNTLMYAGSTTEFHQGKNYWEDPNFLVIRTIKGLDLKWKRHVELIWRAIRELQLKVQDPNKFYDEIQEATLLYHKNHPTPDPIKYVTMLYHIIANKHPDIQTTIKVEEVVPTPPSPSTLTTGKIAFFTPNEFSPALKDKIKSLLTFWEGDRKSTSLCTSSDSLTKYVESYGFHSLDVGGEGNCFFYAVLHQIDLQSGIMREQSSKEILLERVAEYRAKALDYILQHPDKYKNAVTGGLDNFIIENHYQSTTWADHVIIDALANALKVNLVILKNTSDKTVIKVEGGRNTLILGYEQDLHYTSLIFNPILGVPHDIDALLCEDKPSEPLTNP